MDYIKQKLSLLTTSPGCYLMKNKDGIIIYVGKAKNLKNRVSSYFRGKHTGKIAKLVSEIVDFEYIAVGSEVESFILENNLIKKYNPKYNILLKDDKSYPYIELTNEEVPRLKVVRSLSRKKSQKYLYGPYPNVTAARGVVNLLNRMYPIRKCNTYPSKPCLYYHIHQCLGYCTESIAKEQIEEMKEEIIRFLKGDHSFITKRIEEEMQSYSMAMKYEKALEMKQLLDYITVTLTHQQVEVKDGVDRDIFGYFENKGYLSIQVFFIRGSKIVGRHSKILPIIDSLKEELERYIGDFYHNILMPKEILVPEVVDEELLSTYLEATVRKPQKGEKLRLIEMANENAKIALEEQFELIERDEARTLEANEELRKILGLETLDRIEIFDNAHLFGTYNVSGMVVFRNGKPAKNEYRKFKISVDKNDDYNTMREVIYRRYFRVLKDNLERPDLIIVDGGLGQIHAALEIVESLGLKIPVVGLKKDDKHTTNQLLTAYEAYDIDKKSNVFYLLERMQDEVHEFTIHYHKQIRSKGTLESVLDPVAGIGTKRKKQLIRKYKTISQMKKLSAEELQEILPEKVAQELYQYLQDYEKSS